MIHRSEIIRNYILEPLTMVIIAVYDEEVFNNHLALHCRISRKLKTRVNQPVNISLINISLCILQYKPKL